MATVIIETFTGGSSTANILAAPSRLNSIPFDGTLTLEVSCSVADVAGTNYGSITIQMPNGEVPVDNQLIPASWPFTPDSADPHHCLHNDTESIFALEVEQGGHVNVDLAVQGTAYWIVRATLG